MKLFSKTVTALTLGLSLAFAQTAFADQETTAYTPAQISAQQLVDATLWYQSSAEFRAISYQSFNLAREAFDKAQVPAGVVKAVIVDLDETMIDNTGYEAALIKHGASFSNKTWSAWEQAADAKALPGAVEFAKYVNSHGGRMYYVSNRGVKNQASTMANLEKLGFPGVTNETVLLKDKSSDKNIRFSKVAEVANTKIVLWCGDNLYDFPGAYAYKTLEARAKFVEDNKANFGTKFVILPNPMYGSWMSSLAPKFFHHSAAEQNAIRVDSLKVWDGFEKALGK